MNRLFWDWRLNSSSEGKTVQKANTNSNTLKKTKKSK